MADIRQYYDWLMRIGKSRDGQLHERICHADDQAEKPSIASYCEVMGKGRLFNLMAIHLHGFGG
ncbi:MAG: hypothetical protein AAF804_18065 [Bacteroidota bacterium]